MDEDEARTKLRADLDQNMKDRWSYMAEIARATPDMLRACGYRDKSNAEALLIVFQQALAEREKMIQAHERKFP